MYNIYPCPKEGEKWSNPAVCLSPIILALLEADTKEPGVKEYIQRILECLVITAKDKGQLMLLLQSKVHLFSARFIKKITKEKDLALWLTEEKARESPVLSKVGVYEVP